MKIRFGFTIIELLVSIAIFGILSTIVVANFEQGRRRDELVNSADRLGALFRQAHSFALSGRVVDGSVPVGGYGVNINTAFANRALFFAEKGTIITTVVTADGIYNNNDPIIEELKFPAKVSIVSVQDQSSNEKIDYTSRAPLGTQYLYENGVINNTLTMVTVVLKHELSQKQAQITADVVSGLVTVTLLP